MYVILMSPPLVRATDEVQGIWGLGVKQKMPVRSLQREQVGEPKQIQSRRLAGLPNRVFGRRPVAGRDG
jgi:hypothetical protein